MWYSPISPFIIAWLDHILWSHRMASRYTTNLQVKPTGCIYITQGVSYIYSCMSIFYCSSESTLYYIQPIQNVVCHLRQSNICSTWLKTDKRRKVQSNSVLTPSNFWMTAASLWVTQVTNSLLIHIAAAQIGFLSVLLTQCGFLNEWWLKYCICYWQNHYCPATLLWK